MLYLDNSATTKPFSEVLQTYRTAAETFFGNPSSLHRLGGQAEHLMQQARKQTAALLGVSDQEIIFTSGGTESNNMAVKGAAFAGMKHGRHILTSAIEHPSVLEAVKQLTEHFQFEATILPVDENGMVSIEDVKNSLRDDTVLVSIMHVNNEIGSIQPIKEIGRILAEHPRAKFHVDHVQGAIKVPLSFKDCHIDFCSLSAHKFHGLKGTGILYGRKGAALLPLLSGGSQEYTHRSGTENTPGIAAAAKALRLAKEMYGGRLDKIKETKLEIMKAVQGIEGTVLNTAFEGTAPHIVNFSVPGIKAETLVHYLEKKEIYVSTTSACSSRLEAESKTVLAAGKGQELAKSTIRISLSYEHTPELVPALAEALREGIYHLKKVTR
ncbi:cysteine desulfurase [Metabacillus sp. GX 13764]|uniref:cysteine desulfurase family protein n=1 Tax=Metabacillus kandeliae TaxID=2900151 RepID=UPI001E590DAD|nr:cysteine desulfurase family protein [Metabacillus kandeliae]MCD7032752.1 cysteine desulfurase [Metabacillus kandeliae]